MGQQQEQIKEKMRDGSLQQQQSAHK